MIWAAIALIAATTLGLVGWAGRDARGGWPAVAAALLVGLAAYGWQGMPGLAARPVAATQAPRTTAFGEPLDAPTAGFDDGGAIAAATDRFGPGGRWIGLAGSLSRQGRHGDAARVLAGGVRQYPDSFDLWLAYAGALVAHGGGRLSPAAGLAFDRAARIDPAHPAPDFLRGLILADAGKLSEADALWTALLARAPADAPWRADIAERLRVLRAFAARRTASPSTPPSPGPGAPASR